MKKMNYLSSNIKFLRKRKKITQEELAHIVKKSRPLISRWETDGREITVGDIITLSNFFDIPVDKLINHNLELENDTDDELDKLYNKYKTTLSDKDKKIIKTILEESKEDKE